MFFAGETELLVTAGFFTMSSSWERKFDFGASFVGGSESFPAGTSRETVAWEAVFSDFEEEDVDDVFFLCVFVPPFFIEDVFEAISVGGATLLEMAGFVSAAFADTEADEEVVLLAGNVPEGATAEGF